MKKGAVVKVVEHYLCDDVWYGVRGCGMCRQQDSLGELSTGGL